MGAIGSAFFWFFLLDAKLIYILPADTIGNKTVPNRNSEDFFFRDVVTFTTDSL